MKQFKEGDKVRLIKKGKYAYNEIDHESLDWSEKAGIELNQVCVVEWASNVGSLRLEGFQYLHPACKFELVETEIKNEENEKI